ncbi:hypothetical protein K438DRAFT_1637157, partial [Mycena galopus ATCC 62051]
MKKLTDTEAARVPVLVGVPIPRADKEEDQTAHQIAMMALFQPWSQDADSPLKGTDTEWDAAYKEFMKKATPKQMRIMSNMQLLHKSKDTRHD